MRRLNQVVTPEGTDGAALAVGPQHVLTKTLLMKPHPNLSKRVSPHVRRVMAA
jgi:hypothetical protein